MSARAWWKLWTALGSLPGSLALALALWPWGRAVALAAAAGVVGLTALSNIIKWFWFFPRPDNPQGLRPPHPFPHGPSVRGLARPSALLAMFRYADAGSFPSVHSARAWMLAAVWSLALGDAAASVGLCLAAYAVSASRVFLMRHYTRDTFVGALLGVAVGLAAAWGLHPPG